MANLHVENLLPVDSKLLFASRHVTLSSLLPKGEKNGETLPAPELCGRA